MIDVRKANDRGPADHGWLKSFHTFSFADYHDPRHMGFRGLRVMNEDWVQPGQGFGMHPHRDMEIVTYVLEGSLEHKDSMGNGEVLRAGEFQYMSAGTGIRHSEFNPSDSELVHLYQIWIFPNEKGLTPAYAQKKFSDESKRGRWQTVASPDGEDGSLSIRQDAKVYLSILEPGRTLGYDLLPHRAAWMQVMSGAVELNGMKLETGDGAAMTDEPTLEVSGMGEVMLFDLP
ncbi:MAG TPA: pirin family protein [Planctomycetaceae bacterium]|nr:pirin family protein [Planctomycetaceae bacterium]